MLTSQFPSSNLTLLSVLHIAGGAAIHGPNPPIPSHFRSHQLSWSTRNSMTWSLLSLHPHLFTLLVNISALATWALLVSLKHTNIPLSLKTSHLLFPQPDTIPPDPLLLQLTTLFNTFTHKNTNTHAQCPSLITYPATSLFITFHTTCHIPYIYLLTIFIPHRNINSRRARALSCSLVYLQLLKQSPT